MCLPCGWLRSLELELLLTNGSERTWRLPWLVRMTCCVQAAHQAAADSRQPKLLVLVARSPGYLIAALELPGGLHEPARESRGSRAGLRRHWRREPAPCGALEGAPGSRTGRCCPGLLQGSSPSPLRRLRDSAARRELLLLSN